MAQMKYGPVKVTDSPVVVHEDRAAVRREPHVELHLLAAEGHRGAQGWQRVLGVGRGAAAVGADPHARHISGRPRA